MKYEEKKYDYNITLPKTTYHFNKMYQKFILKTYENKDIKFIAYTPNIKYKDSKFKIKRITQKYTVVKNNAFFIYNKYVFLDFLNIADELIDFIGNTIEDFLEQRNTDINFYVHKTLLFCEDLISFSPVLSIYCSNLLQICNRFLVKYNKFKSDNLSRYFIQLFEDLYDDLIQSVENSIQIITATFIDYNPILFNIDLPQHKLFFYIVPKYEVEKKQSKNYIERYYTAVNHSVVEYYIHNITEFINVCLYHFISKKVAIRKCQNCGCYFIAKKRDAIYCEEKSPQNPKRTCKGIRTHFSKKQTQQNKQIASLYDDISTICHNKIGQNNQKYKVVWELFKPLYNQKQTDILYNRYKRKDMIDWLNSIKSNPLQLYKETSNFDLLEEICKKLG